MKTFGASALSSLALVLSSQAAVTLWAGYNLGETGSLGSNNLPQDYSGNGRHFDSPISGGSATLGTPGAYSGSSQYLSTAGTGSEGWYTNAGIASGLTDNFAFSIWANASTNTGATQGDIFTLGGSNGSFKLSLSPNGWAASAHGIAWISSANGASGTFTANLWTHLMLVRQSGTTTFYINDVPSGTYAGAPTNGSLHLSVSPGGATYFDGLLDDARVVTFDSSDSFFSIRAALVPEPTVSLLSCLGGLALLRRRR
jgi:hypothetical protein